jgi:hypothetical protein
MNYKIVVTYTKTIETPADAFNTIPALSVGSLKNVTQEQLDILQNTYPVQWERRIIQNQLILTYTYNSEAGYNARGNDPIVQDLRARRTAWAELNKITVSKRVI